MKKIFLSVAILLVFVTFSYSQNYAVVDDGGDGTCSGAWPAAILGNYVESGTLNGKPYYTGPNGYYMYYTTLYSMGSAMGNYWVVGYPLNGTDINGANLRFYYSSTAATPPLNVRYTRSSNGCGYMKVASGTASPPSASTLSNPYNIGTTSIDLTWSQATGTTGYHVYVSTNSSFTAMVSGMNPLNVPQESGQPYAPTTTTLTGLTIGTTYYVYIKGYSGAGESPASNTISATTIPGSPTATAASGITDQSFQANWNSTSGASWYLLYVSTNSGFSSYVSGYNGLYIADQNYYDVTGLTANIPYYYRLIASNAAGQSGNSNTISLTTASIAPVATAASSITTNSFYANWNSSSSATGYYLDVSLNSSFSPNISGYDNIDIGNVTTHQVLGLNPGITYYYRVRSHNANGTSSNSNPINLITIPNQATATAGTNILQRSFSANWNSVTGATGYYLDVATDPAFTNMMSGYNNLNVSNVITYSVNSGLAPNTLYYYRVRAYNESGSSTSSTTIHLTTVPDVPTTQASSIVFSGITANSMNIGWTNGDGTSRIVFVNEGSGTETDPLNGSTYTASSDWSTKGSQLGTGYYCVYNGTNNNVTLTGLLPGTLYTVRIYEYDGSGEEIKYLGSTATDNPKNQSTSPSAPSVTTSTTIDNITTTSATGYGEVVSSNGSDITERGFVYATTADPTTSNSKIQDPGAATGTFNANILGLQPGTTYHVRAYAINAIGTSYGDDVSFTTTAILAAITTTTGLTESNLDLHNITVTLTGTTFRETLTKTEFTLLNAPAGLSIGSITRNSDTQCTLTLSYDGTDFDTDYTSFKIIVAGTQIPEGVNITSDALTITAVVETTPTVTISGASAITSSSATIGGNVTNSGGETVIEAGVVYSTISGTDPTIDGTGVTKVVGTGTSGEFTANLSNLSFSTTYYVRAYATNTLGTSYSSLISFNTLAVVPDAPTIGTATAGDAQASVSFTAPASNGGSSITGYTVTSNPGNLTGTGASSPIAVTGLTNGTAYTFTVTATNSVGTSQASAASNSVTPKTSQTITFANPGSQNFGTTPTLTATATSGLTPTFTSSTTGVCTITSDGVLTFLTSGTCTINADQAGSNS